MSVVVWLGACCSLIVGRAAHQAHRRRDVGAAVRGQGVVPAARRRRVPIHKQLRSERDGELARALGGKRGLGDPSVPPAREQLRERAAEWMAW